MSKGIFITATATDIGKTFFSGLLLKSLDKAGYDCGYYKAALSGADSIAASDAGYVAKVSGVETKVSYLYKTVASPHLAAQLEGNPLCLKTIVADFKAMCKKHEFIVCEGSGGIICPIRWDEQRIILTDIIKALKLSVLIVADAGLGTINATALTVEHLNNQGISIAGIVLNRYRNTTLHQDNKKMIEAICNVPVVYCVQENANQLIESLFAPLFCEVKI